MHWIGISRRKDCHLLNEAFEASRRTLNGKAIEFCEAGLGKRKNKADAPKTKKHCGVQES